MSTPHISAAQGDFAETILLPGDPLRAKHIADNFLEDAKLVTSVRNMFGYTGTYKGQRLSVMGTGMGIPSISIYATELITQYGVKNLIRVGSAGGLGEEVKIRDVVIGMGASTDSNVNRARLNNHDFAALADFNLLSSAVNTAKEQGIDVKVGNIFTADLFYTPNSEIFPLLHKRGVLAVEMEAAGLYGVAAEHGANALCIVTISDHIMTGEATSADERQTSFDDMVKIALDTAVGL